MTTAAAAPHPTTTAHDHHILSEGDEINPSSEDRIGSRPTLTAGASLEYWTIDAAEAQEVVRAGWGSLPTLTPFAETLGSGQVRAVGNTASPGRWEWRSPGCPGCLFGPWPRLTDLENMSAPEEAAADLAKRRRPNRLPQVFKVKQKQRSAHLGVLLEGGGGDAVAVAVAKLFLHHPFARRRGKGLQKKNSALPTQRGQLKLHSTLHREPDSSDENTQTATTTVGRP